MGTRRRRTPELIIRKLREGEELIGQGNGLAEVCKQLGISEPMWHRCVAHNTAG
jgi:putative transposase